MRARDNPFRTEHILAVRYQFLDADGWRPLRERLRQCRDRVAIVGPEGSGKTTLQEDLAKRLEAEGRTIRWLRLNRENRSSAPRLIRQLFVSAGPDDLLFVDGAEQLGPIRWWRFARRAAAYAGLVITTHKPGRLPTLIECRTSPDLLQRIVDNLLPAADRPDRNSLHQLFCDCDGNLRLCLRSLYDHYAQIARETEFRASVNGRGYLTLRSP